MSYRRPFIVITLVLALLTSTNGRADTLVLSNGDTLSGALLRITDGLFFFQNVVAGKLIVLAEEVKSITTDASWNVKLINGDTLEGHFVYTENSVKLRASTGALSPRLDLVAIQSATPVQKQETTDNQEQTTGAATPGLHTQLSIGQHWRTGTTDYAEPFAKLQVLNQEERYRFFSDSLIEITTEDEFPRLFSIIAQWQFAPDRSTHPQLRLSLERDTANALDLRASIGAGLERTLYEDSLQELDFSATLIAGLEYYQAPAPQSDILLLSLMKTWFLGRMLQDNLIDPDKTLRQNFKRFTTVSYYADQEEQRQDLGLRIGFNYARGLFRGARFNQELSFSPGLTDWGDLRAESLSALQVPITRSLKLKLELELSYEEPPKGLRLDDWHTSLGASVAWDF